MTTATQDLMCRFSVEGLIASRDAVVRALEDAAKNVHEVSAACRSDFNVLIPSLAFGSFAAYEGEFSALAIQELDRSFWYALMEQSGIQDTMSGQAVKDMRRTIESGDCPPLTAETVRATFAGLLQSRETMFGDFIVSIYRHISWDHKTNAPAKFGEKMILKSAGAYYSSDPSIQYESVLCELERALCVLTGKPAPTYETSIRAKVERAEYGEWVSSHEGTFQVKLFKNRNAHVRVRTDLIDEMNRIVSAAYPGALPWSSNERNA